MDKNIEMIRDLNLDIETLKARKDAIKKAALQHRDTVTDLEVDEAKAEVLKINDEIKTKEQALEDAQKRSQEQYKAIKEKNEMNNQLLHYDEKMDRADILATAEYRSAFLKTMQGRELNDVEKRSITSAVASGGAAIPTQTLNVILGVFQEQKGVLDLVTTFNIPELLSIPKENVTTDASWIQEDADSVVGDDSLTSITLSAYKLLRTIKITAKVAVMAVDAFENWIAETMGKKMRAALDKAVFSGSGSNQPTGLETLTWNANNSVSIAKAGSITYDNIVDLEALIDENYVGDAVWVLNRKTLAEILKIKDDNKEPIFKRIVEDGFQGYILGRPVRLDRNVKDGEAYIGDFRSAYIYNFAKGIEFSTSKEAGFMSGSDVYRGLALVDGKPTGVAGTIAKFVKATV